LKKLIQGHLNLTPSVRLLTSHYSKYIIFSTPFLYHWYHYLYILN